MKKRVFILLILLGYILILDFGTVVQAKVVGGWSEKVGSFSENINPAISRKTKATVRHTGKAEEKVINGTTHKRAHGWTTWAGKRHYTTARLERYWGGQVNGTSGRKWGTHGTEAISPYKPYTRDMNPGRAKTYYGT